MPSRILRLCRPAVLGRLVATLVGAVLMTFALIGTSAERQMAAVEAGQQRAVSQLAAGGVALFGPAYLNISDTPNSAYIDGGIGGSSDTILNRLSNRLDPIRVDGALYPLRKAFEQLSIWVIVALLFTSIAKGMILGLAGDARLAGVAKRLAIVVILMWAYPLWDITVFRVLAIPMSNALDSAPLKTALMTRLQTNATPGATLTRGVGTTSVLTMQSRSNQNVIGCAVVAEAGEGESARGTEQNARCFGGRVTGAEEAMNVGYLAGMVQDDEDARTGTSWATRILGAMGPGFSLGARIGESLVTRGGSIRDMLAETVTGWLIQLVHLAIAVLLWFAWLGVIVGRAFSLCFAPMAIAFGLMESKEGSAKKWFLGHAKICLYPVGIMFGVLVMWVVNVAILSTDVLTAGAGLGTAVAGLGVKLAMAAMTFVVILKGGGLSKLMAGDVTAVAADIGNGVRDRAVQLATTGVKGGAAGASFMKNGGAGRMAEGLRDRAHQREASRRLRGGSRILTGLGAVAEEGRHAASGAWQAAKWMGKNRTKSHQYKGMAGVTNAKSYTVDAWREMSRQMEQGRAQRAAGPSEGTEAGLSAADDTFARVAASGLTPSRRAGEQVPISTAGIAVGEQLGRGERERATTLGQALARAGLASDTPISVQVDRSTGVPRVQLDPESLAALTRRMDEDPTLRRAVNDELKGFYGSQPVPTVMGTSGPLPNLNEALLHSPVMVEAAAAASQITARYMDEMLRREQLSASSRTGRESTLEHTLRGMPEALVSRPRGMGDDDYAAHLEEAGQRILRRAWFRSASESERAAQGLSIVEDGAAGEALAANTRELSARVDELSRARMEGGYAQLPERLRGAMAQVSAEQGQVLEQLRERRLVGEGLGFDEETFQLTGRETYRADADSLYQRVAAANPTLSPAEVFEQVREQVERAWREGSLRDPMGGRDSRDPDYGALRTGHLNEAIFGPATEIRVRTTGATTAADGTTTVTGEATVTTRS